MPGPNDPLMHDPITGTNYYASEYNRSYAYYQAIANDPARQEAILETQAAIAQGQPQAVIDQKTAAIDKAILAIPTTIPATHQVVSTTSPITGAPPPGKVFHLDKLYRFFVEHPIDQYGNRFETGATFGACSRTNPAACQGKSFPDEASMLAYAQREGSTLLRVSSADEAFNLIEGKAAVNPANIYVGGLLPSNLMDYLPYAAAAYIGYKLLF